MPRTASRRKKTRRIAMLSVHTCPMATLGGKETGGMNVYVRELSRELGARGLIVDIFTRSQDASVPRVRPLWPNVRVIHLPAGPEQPYNKNLVFDHLPQFLSELRALTAREHITYDLVHSHYWLSGWVARELTRSDSLPTPYRARGAVRPAGRPLVLAQGQGRPNGGVPTVHMFHTLGKMKDMVARSEAERETSTRIRVEEELMRDMSRIVAATPLDKQQMVDLYGADPAKIEVIPLGVDPDMFRPIPPDEARRAIGMDVPGLCNLILFVGRLDPLKGLDTLLRAMCKLTELEPDLAKNWCLAVIGGDEEGEGSGMDNELECLDKLKNEVGMRDLVIFLGSRAQDTLAYYYSAATVVVVPSHYESFGLVALEAMACGTPVIASRVGGLQLTVEDGVTGFLVPAGEPDPLAEKLRLLLLDPELRERLGANARQKAQAYTWQVVAERILNLYEGLW